jgi:succinylglutamic semialdehyde dehydrogenase
MSLSELVSFNPCNSEAIWRGQIADQAAVSQAVDHARLAAAEWARQPLDARLVIVRAFQANVKSESEAFARLIAEETGKPLWEAHTEVASVAAKVDISITAHAERSGQDTTEAGAMVQSLRHKPHGVLAVLGPYNFPAHLPNGHIVPALIAGNCVLFKPSEQTPATALFMADLWRRAGLPDGVLQMIIGDGETGKMLAAHDGIDGLLFTGSATTGAALHRQFAGVPHKILALEMGGNNPLVAWDIEDAEAAASLVIASAFQTAGQRCTCARRLIVEHGAKGDVLIDAVIALAKKLRIGGAFDQPPPFMGPVISNRVVDQLEAGITSLDGRTLLAHQRIEPDLPFLSPAILDVTDAAARSDEELFGPVLQAIKVPDFEAALREMNATRFGLSAGLIGGDKALFDRFWAASRAGVVNWNRPLTGASSAAPFGGIGASGNHRPSAYYAADYCAFPVASLEQQQLETVALTGILP